MQPQMGPQDESCDEYLAAPTCKQAQRSSLPRLRNSNIGCINRSDHRPDPSTAQIRRCIAMLFIEWQLAAGRAARSCKHLYTIEHMPGGHIRASPAEIHTLPPRPRHHKQPFEQGERTTRTAKAQQRQPQSGPVHRDDNRGITAYGASGAPPSSGLRAACCGTQPATQAVQLAT